MTAPERIWATINGASTRIPDGGRQLIGGWSQDRDRPRAVEYVRADLYAAIEAQLAERVKVEPLEWKERVGVDGTFDAYTSIGHYIATITDDDRGMWFAVGLTQSNYCAPDIDIAKAAAQADYERRILSALEATAAPMVTEALKAALTTMYRYQRAGCGDDVFYDDLSQSIRKVEAALTAAQEAGKQYPTTTAAEADPDRLFERAYAEAAGTLPPAD